MRIADLMIKMSWLVCPCAGQWRVHEQILSEIKEKTSLWNQVLLKIQLELDCRWTSISLMLMITCQSLACGPRREDCWSKVAFWGKWNDTDTVHSVWNAARISSSHYHLINPLQTLEWLKQTICTERFRAVVLKVWPVGQCWAPERIIKCTHNILIIQGQFQCFFFQ